MNKGVRVICKLTDGIEVCGEFDSDGLVTVSAMEIRQMPVAAYSEGDAFEQVLTDAKQNLTLYSEVWRSARVDAELLGEITFGEVYDRLDLGNHSSLSTEYLFSNWLKIHEKEDVFDGILRGGLYENDISDSLDSMWADCVEIFTDMVSTLVGNGTSILLARAQNLTYRRRAGYQIIDTLGMEGEDVLRKLLPNTSEFSLSIFDDKDGRIRILCSHHDVPTGSCIVIEGIDNIIESMETDTLVAIAREWLHRVDGYDDHIYRSVLNLWGIEKEVPKGYKVLHHLTKYSRKGLITLVQWIVSEDREFAYYPVEKYI